MATLEERIAACFPTPQADMGLDFLHHRGGLPLGVADLAESAQRIRWCRAYIASAVAFALFIERPEAFRRGAKEAAAAIEERLALPEPGSGGELLEQLIYALDLNADLGERSPIDPQFTFFGSYLLNPTGLRFLAQGGAVSLGILVSVFGMVQLSKEFGAKECREHNDEITNRRLAMLMEVYERAGQLNERVEAGMGLILRASDIAAERCGSLLNGVDIKVTAAPGKRFAIRIGSEPAPSSVPSP